MSKAGLLLFFALLLPPTLFAEPSGSDETPAPEFQTEAIPLEDLNLEIDEGVREGLLAALKRFYEKHTAPEVREALHLVHEALESGNDDAVGWKEKLKSWREMFNFLQIAINANRVYQIKGKHGSVKDLIPDIITLTIFTHTTEVTFVLWGNAIGSAFGASEATHAAITAIGVVISAPGAVFGMPFLEPICMLGGACYSFSPKFRKVIRLGSKGLMYVAKPIGRLLNWFAFQEQERLEYIDNQLAELERLGLNFPPQISEVSPEQVDVKFGDDLLNLTFRLHPEDGLMHLEDLRLDRTQRDNAEQLLEERSLGLFGLNTKNLIEQLIRFEQESRLHQLQEKIFVDNIDESSRELKIKFKRGAARLTPHKSIKGTTPKFAAKPKACWQAWAEGTGR